MPQLPRPRVRVGGLSDDVYVVTHGTEKDGLLTATRKLKVTADFEDCCRELGYQKPGILTPSIGLLSKLGSIVAHVDEGLSENGVPLDVAVVRLLLEDAEIVPWMWAMGKRGLVPVSRGGP